MWLIVDNNRTKSVKRLCGTQKIPAGILKETGQARIYISVRCSVEF